MSSFDRVRYWTRRRSNNRRHNAQFSRDSTNGALSVLEITVTEGPPLHAHDHEHESFYVLERELSVV